MPVLFKYKKDFLVWVLENYKDFSGKIESNTYLDPQGELQYNTEVHVFRPAPTVTCT